MADLDALLDAIPVGDIAKQLGISDDVAEAAVKQVLPGLVGGLAANAQRDEKSQTNDTGQSDEQDDRQIIAQQIGHKAAYCYGRPLRRPKSARRGSATPGERRWLIPST